MIDRSNLQSRMQLGSRGSSNHHRNMNPCTFQFTYHMYHFFERRRNQPTQSDDVHLFTDSRFDNLLGRHHHTQVDDFISVAGHHYPDNVLPDVVHIPFYCSQQHFPGTASPFLLFSFDIRLQNRYRTFHGTGCLDYLRQEHLSRTEQITHMIHTGHQRPFDDTYRIGIMLQRLVQIFIQKIADTFHQRMLQTFFHRRTFTPGQMRYRSLSGCTFLFCLQPFGRFYQPFGRIRTTVEYYIFDTFQDVGRNIGIQYGRSRIDNSHIHSLTDGMIQKDCMHRLADIVVPTERERQVTDSPAHMSSRQIPANPSGRFNEIHRIIVMLFDTRRYSQYIRVEDDILRTEIHHLSQNPVRPFANLYLPGKGIGLSFLIESHHNDRRTVLLNEPGVFDELFFTFLQGDGVDNTFTLHTLQSGEDNLPF